MKFVNIDDFVILIYFRISFRFTSVMFLASHRFWLVIQLLEMVCKLRLVMAIFH